MYSFSTDKPEIQKYDARFRVPFCIEQITIGEGEEAVQQFRARALFAAKTPSLAEKQGLIADELNQDVNNYINSHYDTGTQNSFNGLYSKRSTPDAVRDMLDSVWAWIESIMVFYYTKKAEIMASDEPEMVVWDFSQFDETKPDVSLSALVTGV